MASNHVKNETTSKIQTTTHTMPIFIVPTFRDRPTSPLAFVLSSKYPFEDTKKKWKLLNGIKNKKRGKEMAPLHDPFPHAHK
jgi:hypothetical protein